MYTVFGDAPMPTFGNVGWICPKCGRVYAPTTPSCFVCGSEDKGAASNKIEEKPPSLLDILNPKLFNNHNFLNQNQPNENKDSNIEKEN